MKYVCPDCGFEATDSGDCPSCETPLLKRADTDTLEAAERDTEGAKEAGDEFEEDEDGEEDLW